MLDTLFSSAVGDSLSFLNALSVLGSSLLFGLFISLVYMKTHQKEGYSSSFVITLIMLPAIISIIIFLVGNNIARAFSLAGAFTLIRFRSAPGDPKDIAYVFFTLGIGLGCGMGYIGYAALFAVVLCLAMIVLQAVHFAKPKSTAMQLKIIIPEDLNFQGVFDDLLDRYCDFWVQKKIKTSDFGTLFELVYYIQIKQTADQKAFLDELRCRNGNLNICLTLKEFEDKQTF